MGTQQPGAESYATDAPLMELFGTPARTRLVSVFVAERGRDLTVSALARQAGLSRTTVYEHLDPLLDLGVVEVSRQLGDGHSTLYQLAEDSEIAAYCYRLEGLTLQRLLENDGHC